MELTGLKGKTALVTGASRGMGKAIAKLLAQSGVKVVCAARNQDVLLQACSEIEKEGGVAVPVQADVALAADRKQLVDKAITSFGGIDFLINNAGIHINKEALELEDDEFIRTLQVNLIPMFSLSRDIARQMIPRGGGKIVNIGSVSGQGGGSQQVAYCASKAGVEAITRSFAMEWARHNIQVNTVAPGYVHTDMSKPAWDDEKIRNFIQRRIPANRWGEPEDVAYLAVFLCSREADYMTGHIYYTDGGAMFSH